METTLPDEEKTPTDRPDQRLWKTDDLARYIGCSVREIRNRRWAGLPTIKFRHLIRFEPEVAKAWLREQRYTKHQKVFDYTIKFGGFIKCGWQDDYPNWESGGSRN